MHPKDFQQSLPKLVKDRIKENGNKEVTVLAREEP
jgi:hypothetical protein